MATMKIYALRVFKKAVLIVVK